VTFRALSLTLLLLLALAPAARADARLVIRGAGWGHGVGMSQWGAYGFALRGSGYREILRHYYTGTEIGRVDGSRVVRVLLGSAASFSGATRAGTRRVRPERAYGLRQRADGRLDLLSPTRRRLATLPAPLRVTGPGAVRTRGGAWRGALEFRPGDGGPSVVNAVSLEDYIAGVVSRESPSSWPLEALKAQAVAARTYAVTTSKGGAGFDHYADTRSQVYAGVAAETPSTNRAVAETRGEVVTHGARPVVTYFFSSSGGRTEDVENSVLGRTPLPWLRSVPDPYDTHSPRHRWGPIRLTVRQAEARLRGLVRGRFRGIAVVRRGTSPRIVAADVVGTRGNVRVDGATLRARLNLNDTWAFFTLIDTKAEDRETGKEAGPTGGATPVARRSWLELLRALPAASAGAVHGRIVPARPGATVRLERRAGGAWRAAGLAKLGSGGRYAFRVAHPGAYRVRYAGEPGPVVRVR